MSTLEILSGVQVARTKTRLILSRIFGLGVVILLVFGSNYWGASQNIVFEETLFLAGVLLAVLGFVGRLWSLSYIAGKKKRVLVTAGPYSLCRHPLYFFTFIGGTGLGLCTETLSATLLFVLGFAIYYPHVIRTEEKFLNLNFPDYDDYKRQVPLFFPSWSNFVDGEIVQVDAKAFRRELMQAGGFLCFMGIVEFVDALHRAELLPTYFLIP